MKKKTKSSIEQGTYGDMKKIDDFLPAPEDLVLRDRDDSVKVTMILDKHSIEFFKKEAKRLDSSYQRMIRNLINEYVAKYQK